MTPSRPCAPRLTALAAVAACGIAALGAGGCGGSSSASSPPTTAAHATAAPVPRPVGEAVLTVTGKVTRPNTGRRVAFDLAGLERGGTTAVTLYEPFEERDMSFRAVPFRDVLRAAGVTGTTLHMTALNDYTVDVPIDVASSDGVWLATRNGNGSRIDVAHGGPIRLVFAKDARGADVDRYWIWSIATVNAT